MADVKDKVKGAIDTAADKAKNATDKASEKAKEGLQKAGQAVKNASLDLLRRSKRRVLPPDITGPADPTAAPLPALEMPWLQPYPERLLEEVAAAGVGA